jgi:xanthosine utilization system XapX-like protein
LHQFEEAASMADFPALRYDYTGANLYAVLRNAAGQHWDTTGTPAFETLVPADWTNYDITATETPASSYQYIAAVPATLAAGVVYVDYYLRAGANPAITDFLIGTGTYYWDGSAVRPLASTFVASGAIASSSFAANAIDAASISADATAEIAAAILGTSLSESPTAGTVGEALLYGLAVGKYKLSVSGTTMTLYKSNGTDALKTWTLNSATNPTSRTPA